jgi:hypothetical protein
MRLVRGFACWVVLSAVGAAASPLDFSAIADLSIPVNYSGPSLLITDSFDFLGEVVVTGGTGNGFLVLTVRGQGTIFDTPESEGSAVFTASLGSQQTYQDAGATPGDPSFTCSYWDGCALPVTFGQPALLTLHGQVESYFSTLDMQTGYYSGPVLAELSMQVTGVGLFTAAGFEFMPDAVVSIQSDSTTPEPGTAWLCLLGILCSCLHSRELSFNAFRSLAQYWAFSPTRKQTGT